MAVVNGYVTLSEVKAALRLTSAGDDARIEGCIEGASRAIDEICGRTFFTSVSAIRVFAPSADLRTCLFDDCAAPPAVASWTGTGWVALTSGVDYQLLPVSAAQTGRPYTGVEMITGRNFFAPSIASVRRTVQVTALWGWPTVPHAVREACRLQAINLFKRADSPGGVVSGDFGAFRIPRIDPDVAMLVKPLKRTVIG